MKERTGTDTAQAESRYKTRYIGGKTQVARNPIQIELFQAGMGLGKKTPRGLSIHIGAEHTTNGLRQTVCTCKRQSIDIIRFLLIAVIAPVEGLDYISNRSQNLLLVATPRFPSGRRIICCSTVGLSSKSVCRDLNQATWSRIGSKNAADTSHMSSIGLDQPEFRIRVRAGPT